MQQRIFKAGAEISAIKELELFVSPAGEKLWQQIWMDPEGWTHNYITLEKRGEDVLSAFCTSRFVDAECILKVDVNCWNFFFLAFVYLIYF